MKYCGNELYYFEKAHKWKDYWLSMAYPHMKGILIDVGAGIGSTYKSIDKSRVNVKKWIFIEPDDNFISKLISLTKENNIIECTHRGKFLDEYKEYVDTILYIDVLEHIKDDKNELMEASKKLNKDGCIILLLPAHNILYSNFDKSIGHYRRYNKKMINVIIKDINLVVVDMKYLDSIGFSISMIMKIFNLENFITHKSVYIWNKFLIPLSKILDKLFYNKLGKSLFVVLRKK